MSNNQELLIASSEGNLDQVKLLIEQGALANYRNDMGQTPLIAACSFGNLDLVKYLINNTNANETMAAEDIYGFTPLSYAVQKGHLPIVKYLCESFPLLSLKYGKGDKAYHLIHLAVSEGHLNIIQYFYKKDSKLKNENDNLARITPIFTAVSAGHLNIVKYFFKIKAKTKNNERPLLHLAAAKGHLDIVKYLLIPNRHGAKAKSDAHQVGGDGKTAIELAVQYGKLNIVEFMLGLFPELMLRKFGPMKRGIVHWAAIYGHENIINYLYSKFPEIINERDGAGVPPALLAASQLHHQLVKRLLELKADTKQSINQMADLIHVAANQCGYSLVLCLSLGSNPIQDINLRNDSVGATPLFFAAANHKSSMFRFLMSQGAYIDPATYNGTTILEQCEHISDSNQRKIFLDILNAAELLFKIAEKKPESSNVNYKELFKSLDISDIILKATDDISTHIPTSALNGRRIKDGNTALHVALMQKVLNKPFIQFLIFGGANLDLVNHDQVSCYDLIMKCDDPFLKAYAQVFKQVAELVQLTWLYNNQKKLDSASFSHLEHGSGQDFQSRFAKRIEILQQNLSQSMVESYKIKNKEELTEFCALAGALLGFPIGYLRHPNIFKDPALDYLSLFPVEAFDLLKQVPKSYRKFKYVNYLLFKLLSTGQISLEINKDSSGLEAEADAMDSMFFMDKPEVEFPVVRQGIPGMVLSEEQHILHLKFIIRFAINASDCIRDTSLGQYINEYLFSSTGFKRHLRGIEGFKNFSDPESCLNYIETIRKEQLQFTNPADLAEESLRMDEEISNLDQTLQEKELEKNDLSAKIAQVQAEHRAFIDKQLENIKKSSGFEQESDIKQDSEVKQQHDKNKTAEMAQAAAEMAQAAAEMAQAEEEMAEDAANVKPKETNAMSSDAQGKAAATEPEILLFSERNPKKRKGADLDTDKDVEQPAQKRSKN